MTGILPVTAIQQSGFHVGVIGMSGFNAKFVNNGRMIAFYNSDYGVYTYTETNSDVQYAALYKVVSAPQFPTGYAVQFTGSAVQLSSTNVINSTSTGATWALNDHIIVTREQTTVQVSSPTTLSVSVRCLVRDGDTLTYGPLTSTVTALTSWDGGTYAQCRIDETRFIRLYGTTPTTVIASVSTVAGAAQIEICTVNDDGTVEVGNTQYDSTGLSVNGITGASLFSGSGAAAATLLTSVNYCSLSAGKLYGTGTDGALGLQAVSRTAINFDPLAAVICPGGGYAYNTGSNGFRDIAWARTPTPGTNGDQILVDEARSVFSTLADSGTAFSQATTPVSSNASDYFLSTADPAMPRLTDEYVEVYGHRIDATHYTINYTRFSQDGNSLAFTAYDQATAITSAYSGRSGFNQLGVANNSIQTAVARHTGNKVAFLMAISNGFTTVYSPWAFQMT